MVPTEEPSAENFSGNGGRQKFWCLERLDHTEYEVRCGYAYVMGENDLVVPYRDMGTLTVAKIICSECFVFAGEEGS